MGIVGIIVNPASGKDVRRLVARASVFDNQEKQAIVRRVLSGIVATAGADCPIAYLDDPHGITRTAIDEAGAGASAQPVAATRTASVLDTRTATRCLRELGCRVIVTLGGDGTNRAVASVWPDAPLVPISTGTNNVFPRLMEATVAGAAAGLIAAGHIDVADCARQHKQIRVETEGAAGDLALIDAVLCDERFVGARALLAPERLKVVLLSRADPAAVGMTALGGLIEPVDDTAEHGLLLHLDGSGEVINVPIAPGYYRGVAVARWETLGFGQPAEVTGPGVLAFDGERERVLLAGRRARMWLERTGPWVVDVAQALHLTAARRALRLTASVPPPARLREA